MATARTIIYDASELAIAAIIILMFISVGSGIAKHDAYQKKYLANYMAFSFDSMMAVSGDVAINTNIKTPQDFTARINPGFIEINKLEDPGSPIFWGYYHSSSNVLVDPRTAKASNLAIIKEGGIIKIGETLTFEGLDSCRLDLDTAGDMENTRIYIDISDNIILADIAARIKTFCKNCVILSGDDVQGKINQLQNPDMIISINSHSDVLTRVISPLNDKGLKLGCIMSNSLSQSPKINRLERSMISVDQVAENNYMKIMSNDVPSVSVELNLETDPLTEKESKDIADLIINSFGDYYKAKAEPKTEAAQPPLLAQIEEPKPEEKVEEKKSEPNAQVISG